MATLKDVARECGLTVSTVSRILNNRGYISESSREKVYKAMKTLNYQPNEVARSLSKKATNTIGVIVPHISHPYFAELISNLEHQAAKQGYKILLCNSQAIEEKEKKYVDMCTSNRVAGIILCSGTVAIQEFEKFDVPMITIERFLERGTAAVECDNHLGGSLAAQCLIRKGCKNLLHFSGVCEVPMPADDRAEGFKQVCEEEKIHYTEISTNEWQYNNMEYHDGIEQALRKYPETDGVFASSDFIAAQVLQVCSKLGISVPDQIKLIGFDDVMVSRVTTPRISTIHQPIKEMAQTAVSYLIQAAEGQMVPRRSVLPVSLVERETT